jgi:tight adherence protein B
VTVVLAALLAGAAAAVLVGVPRPAELRVRAVLRAGRVRTPGRGRTWAAAPGWWPAVPAVVVVLAVLVVAGPPLVVPLLLVSAAGAALSRVQRTRALAARRRDERARAVEACAALAGELRAGRSPADALEAAAQVASGAFAAALRAAAGAVRLGGDPVASLRPSEECAVPEVLRALAACWTVCAGAGGGLAAAVERLEGGLRAEQAQRRAVDAELAGPRATAGLLAVLPAGGLLLAAGLGADPVTVLLTTPVGLVCLAAGLGLDALGVWWTGRLVASAGGRA